MAVRVKFNDDTNCHSTPYATHTHTHTHTNTHNPPIDTDPEMANTIFIENFLHYKDVFPNAEVVYYFSVY
jgi:hypothetical protein